MCFSPKVTLATFIIEWSLAFYVYFKYSFTKLKWVVIATLLLLGGFQLMEYLICRTLYQLFWARLGFVMTTFLPVLGLHVVCLIDDTTKRGFKISKALVYLGYLFSVVWSAAFIFYVPVFISAKCTPYYILFDNQLTYFWLGYSLFYFGYIVLTLINLVSIYTRKHSLFRSASLWISIGYLSFILPTYLVTTVFPIMDIGFPSVLCGFAIFLAIILVAKVLPECYHHKTMLR